MFLTEQSSNAGALVVRDIRERTFEFAVSVLGLVRRLPHDPASRVVGGQLARCGMGVGANVEEAQDAHSKKEFIRKMNIARGEAREALYWLRLVQVSRLLPAEALKPVLREADELVRILVAIVRRARGVEHG